MSDENRQLVVDAHFYTRRMGKDNFPLALALPFPLPLPLWPEAARTSPTMVRGSALRRRARRRLALTVGRPFDLVARCSRLRRGRGRWRFGCSLAVACRCCGVGNRFWSVWCALASAEMSGVGAWQPTV